MLDPKDFGNPREQEVGVERAVVYAFPRQFQRVNEQGIVPGNYEGKE